MGKHDDGDDDDDDLNGMSCLGFLIIALFWRAKAVEGRYSKRRYHSCSA